jgi:peptide-methionine (R)-S-oxide reductase
VLAAQAFAKMTTKRQRSVVLVWLLESVLAFLPASHIRLPIALTVQCARSVTELSLHGESHREISHDDRTDSQRRLVWKRAAVQTLSVALGGSALLALTCPVWASNRSRSEGYKVQKSDTEWQSILSPLQYNILRQGGTERPGFSILEKEKRPGVYVCAGCGTKLFVSQDKFNSGTGWPSFARSVDGNVEVEAVNPITASLSGAELRCQTCGGHLGDVFRDGFLFIGTPAAVTGKRYCIDGAALVFYPENTGDARSSPSPPFLRGDLSAGSQGPLGSFLNPPRIVPRDRSDATNM